MKIEIGEKNCLLVFLDKHDMAALHLNAATVTYNDDACRKTIQAIYTDAATQVNFVPQQHSSKVIELLPFEDGSMLLCFSFKQKPFRLNVHVRKKERSCVFEFCNKAQTQFFFKTVSPPPSFRLFENSGAYRLIVPESCCKTEPITEFAERIRHPFALSETAEYWREVSED